MRRPELPFKAKQSHAHKIWCETAIPFRCKPEACQIKAPGFGTYGLGQLHNLIMMLLLSTLFYTPCCSLTEEKKEERTKIK